MELLEVALECALAGRPAADAAIVVEDAHPRAVTYGELRRWIAALRPQLRALGVRPGATLAFYTDRTPEAIAATLAAVLEGAVFCHHDTAYGLPQLERAVFDTRALALVVDAHGLQQLANASRDPVALRSVYLATDPTPDGAAALPRLSLDAPDASAGLTRRDAHTIAESAGTLCFTSGSTGRPKCIHLPGHAYVANALSDAAVYGACASDRILHMLSIGHSYGLIQLFSTLLNGGALHVWNGGVMSKREWLARVQAIVAGSRITGFHCGASLFHTFADAAQGVLFPAPTSLRFVSLAGAPLPPAQVDRVAAVLGPQVALYKEYGQGEVSRLTVLHANAPEHHARRGGVGRAVPGNVVFAAADRMTVAAPGEPGEMAIVSPTRSMVGYLGDDALTRERMGTHAAFPGATVIYTGDQGYVDADGYVFLLGRRNAVFKRNWVLVYPEAVETDLAQHPEIVEAAVFGVEVRGAVQPGRIVAIVRTRTPVAVEALAAWAREHVESSRVPDDLQRWDELPRTASGKLDRVEIRRRYLTGACPWDVVA